MLNKMNLIKASLFKKIFLLFVIMVVSFFTFSCGLYNKVDKDVPVNAQERARKNVNEGRGISIKGLVGGKGTNFEFSSSNPLWRATLATLDFLPLSNVDYSGGIIITDWYSASSENESVKISIQFLSNDIRSDSLKIVVFKKVCNSQASCKTSKSDSKIKEELSRNILVRAKEFELADKKSKK